MQQFVVGQPVALAIEFKDAAGNTVTPTSATATFYDQFGDVLEIQTLAVDATSITPAVAGRLPITAGVERTATVTFTYDDAGTPKERSFTLTWLLMAGLRVGVNTAMSLEVANTFANPSLSGWAAANPEQRALALEAAFARLMTLSFIVLPYGQTRTQRIVRFDESHPLVLRDLSERFVAALRTAQVLEADTILGGEPEQARRDAGLLSESIGESSMMFQGGGHLKLGVSRRTLQALRGFVAYETRVSRG